MIETLDFGVFDVSCDGCSYQESFDTPYDSAPGESTRGDWDSLMQQMGESGWTKRKVHGEWEHHCSDCSGG